MQMNLDYGFKNIDKDASVKVTLYQVYNSS